MYVYIYVLYNIKIAEIPLVPAMDGQWRSSRIVSVRTNRVLNKH